MERVRARDITVAEMVVGYQFGFSNIVNTGQTVTRIPDGMSGFGSRSSEA